LAANETPDDEYEVRVFDWDKIKGLDDVVEQVSDMFGDCEEDDFAGLLREPSEDDEWSRLADSWLPIAVTGTGGQKFLAHDDEGFAFPQFSSMVLVHIEEVDGPATPLYALDVDGTAMSSPSVPRFTIGGVEQTISSWSLCEPVNPEGDI
jgi:hypothetical protein